MAITTKKSEKRTIYRVDIDEKLVKVLPETSATQVTINTISGLTATNTQEALSQVYDQAKKGGVQSVNGKTNVVTLGAGDVGALPDSTKYGKTLVVQYTAGSGALSIILKDQDGTQISSDSVNLPKEMFVESGSVKTCDTPNVPVSGYIVGDKYIDLVLNSQAHVYIKVSDLVDQMSGETTGTGNVISGAVVSGNKITFTKGITAVTSINKKTGSNITLTKGDIDLGDVDNTADTNKNVATARELATARNINIIGDAEGNAAFKGNTNIDIKLTLATQPNVTVGKGSAFIVDSKGRITQAGDIIEFGEPGVTTPSNRLAVGGLFFEQQA